jgi:hypothetical protein
MSHRHSGCPLCGGQLSARDLLNACDELADAGLGIIAARCPHCPHCPHCQGRLEIRPTAGHLEIGYIVGQRFDVAFSLDCVGLEVLADAGDGGLRLRMQEKGWEFREE